MNQTIEQLAHLLPLLALPPQQLDLPLDLQNILALFSMLVQ